MKLRHVAACIVGPALALGIAVAAYGAQASPRVQRVFAKPAQAAEALYRAVRDDDRAAMRAVLGPGSNEVIDSGNATEDRVARLRFVAAYEQSMRIEPRGARRAELVIGPQEWVLPFPLVREARGWRFDTLAGRNEVIARRVGRNELATLQAVLAYVDAQREYALRAHDDVGPGVYARRIASTPGCHDGLYWTPTREAPLSPLGPMFSFAAAGETADGRSRPYHGYFFRVLQAQGPHAAGGAGEYIVEGRLIGGFAVVAWPARYRVSGVRTFTVNQDGVVYSRDLGRRTDAMARAMQRFDPDASWRREAGTVAFSEEGERMRHLAGELGCMLCHRDAPAPRAPGDAAPVAPSWREIADRYEGTPDAEERLTRIVIEGSDPSERHWKGRPEFAAMGGNAPRITPDEARALVRWILSTGR